MREQIAEEKALEQLIQNDDPCLQHVRTILDAGYKPGGGSWEGQKARAAALRALMEKVAQAAIDASAEATLGVRATNTGNLKRTGDEWCGYDAATLDCHKRVSALSPKAIVEGVK